MIAIISLLTIAAIAGTFAAVRGIVQMEKAMRASERRRGLRK